MRELSFGKGLQRMGKTAHKIYIYVFQADDGRTGEARLQEAVRDYCKNQEARCPELLRVERTEKGKPYFSNCPNIQFSVSHSGKYWACAVSREVVGLDLQEHTLKKRMAEVEMEARLWKLSRRFFSADEVRFVEEDINNTFFAVWAAREAYVKYLGCGIDKHFKEYCVLPELQVDRLALQKKSEESGLSLQKESGENRTALQDLSGDASWQAMQAAFWKCEWTEPEGLTYTLCVCTQDPGECELILWDK